MDPIAQPPRSDGEPGDSRADVGLVDLVDQALVHLDGLRDRPRLSSAVTALLVFVLVAGWGLSRWRSVEPIDERIPLVDEVIVGTAAEADAGSGAPTVPPAPVGPPNGDADSAAPTTEIVRLVVHVSGAVRNEGLVEVTTGSRLADAIDAAGGPTDTADIHRLNLATPVVDGMHIRVPEHGEEGENATRPLIESPIAGSGSGRSGEPAGSDGPAVNVNQADVVELQRLPGVGPAIADAIVTWRDDNGPFGAIDELLDVPGIGPAKLAAIEDLVTI